MLISARPVEELQCAPGPRQDGGRDVSFISVPSASTKRGQRTRRTRGSAGCPPPGPRRHGRVTKARRPRAHRRRGDETRESSRRGHTAPHSRRHRDSRRMRSPARCRLNSGAFGAADAGSRDCELCSLARPRVREQHQNGAGPAQVERACTYGDTGPTCAASLQTHLQQRPALAALAVGRAKEEQEACAVCAECDAESRAAGRSLQSVACTLPPM
jgi:hypothetical protein